MAKFEKKDYSLTKRKGSPYIYVEFEVIEDGKIKRPKLSTGQTDKVSADRVCKRNMARIGTPVPLVRKGNLFKDFARDFFDFDTSPYIKKRNLRGKVKVKGKEKEKKIGHDWADTCQRRLDKYLIDHWGEFKLKKITPYLINEWLDTLYERCAPNTVVQIFGIFRLILDEAVKKGKIEKNPCLDEIVDKPKKVESEQRDILPPRAIYDLFNPENIAEVWKNEKIYYVANYLSAYTGMRLGEIMALRDEDIKECRKASFLIISQSYSLKYGLKDTKTHQKRIIPIHPYILQLLKEIKPASGFVFSLDGGKTPVKGAIRRALYRALDRLGITKEVRKEWNVVFHSWRYHCNTMLLEAGMPIAGVQAITGHKSLKMTERYSKVDARAFTKEFLKIQDRFVDVGA